MRTIVKPVVLLVFLLALSACASGRQGQEAAEPDTTVRVQNQNFLDMTVYVLRGSQRIRLGMVPGVSTRTFTIPPNLVFGATSLRFLADPIGSSQTSVSFDIVVNPGDEIQMIIPS